MGIRSDSFNIYLGGARSVGQNALMGHSEFGFILKLFVLFSVTVRKVVVVAELLRFHIFHGRAGLLTTSLGAV